jgi:hypothetical protein
LNWGDNARVPSMHQPPLVMKIVNFICRIFLKIFVDSYSV